MLLTITLILLAIVALAAVEIWLFSQLDERDHRDRCSRPSSSRIRRRGGCAAASARRAL